VIAVGTDGGVPMSARLKTIPTALPAATVRDVIKTQVADDLARDQHGDGATNRDQTDQHDVPIQIGFGFGAALPRRAG